MSTKRKNNVDMKKNKKRHEFNVHLNQEDRDIVANGSIDYDPGAAFQGLGAGQNATDSFSYSISDGRGGADSATVTVTVDGLDEPAVDGFSFVAIADTPYSSSEFLVLSNIIDNLPQESEFLVHLGDIKGGATNCPVQNYQDVATLLQSSSMPAFIIPGDNEYNDCNNPSQAWSFWDENFTQFDQNFTHNIDTAYQQGREENFSFLVDETLFIGINLVGGTVHDSQEWIDRAADNLQWVQNNFSQFGDQVDSAVLFAHTFTGSRSIYQDFEEGLISIAQDFGDPILYLMGDSHRWLLDQPYSEAPNVTRVILERTTDISAGGAPLTVFVSDDPIEPFSFDHDFDILIA